MEQKEYCEPIKTYEEALQYSTIRVTPAKFHKFPKDGYSCTNFAFDCHIQSEEIDRRKFLPQIKVPKTLVCHDMKGGYLEDK